ncbi:hypothetical protein ACA910_012381 [Epithemia clementina (nom. ined.)]
MSSGRSPEADQPQQESSRGGSVKTYYSISWLAKLLPTSNSSSSSTTTPNHSPTTTTNGSNTTNQSSSSSTTTPTTTETTIASLASRYDDDFLLSCRSRIVTTLWSGVGRNVFPHLVQSYLWPNRTRHNNYTDPYQYENELLSPSLVDPLVICVTVAAVIFGGLRFSSTPTFQRFLVQGQLMPPPNTTTATTTTLPAAAPRTLNLPRTALARTGAPHTKNNSTTGTTSPKLSYGPSFLEARTELVKDKALLVPQIVVDAIMSVLMGLSTTYFWQLGHPTPPLYQTLSQAPLVSGRSRVHETICPKLEQLLEEFQQEQQQEQHEQSLKQPSSSAAAAAKKFTTLDLTDRGTALIFRNDHLRSNAAESTNYDINRILWSAHVMNYNCQLRTHYLALLRQEEEEAEVEQEEEQVEELERDAQQQQDDQTTHSSRPKQEQQQQQPPTENQGVVVGSVPFPGLRGRAWH